MLCKMASKLSLPEPYSRHVKVVEINPRQERSKHKVFVLQILLATRLHSCSHHLQGGPRDQKSHFSNLAMSLRQKKYRMVDMYDDFYRGIITEENFKPAVKMDETVPCQEMLLYMGPQTQDGGILHNHSLFLIFNCGCGKALF